MLFFVLLGFLTACTPITACPSNTCLLHAHIIEMWYDNYATNVYLSVLPVSVCVCGCNSVDCVCGCNSVDCVCVDNAIETSSVMNDARLTRE